MTRWDMEGGALFFAWPEFLRCPCSAVQWSRGGSSFPLSSNFSPLPRPSLSPSSSVAGCVAFLRDFPLGRGRRDGGTRRRGEGLPSAAVPLYSDTRDAIPGKIIVLRGQSGNHVDDIFSKIKALAELSMHPKSLLHLCVCLLVTFRWRC